MVHAPEELSVTLAVRSPANISSSLTLAGRKVVITSLTLAVAGTPIAGLLSPKPPFAAGGGRGESRSIGVEDIVKDEDKTKLC